MPIRKHNQLEDNKVHRRKFHISSSRIFYFGIGIFIIVWITLQSKLLANRPMLSVTGRVRTEYKRGNRKRGIVLPLHDDIVPMGYALILDLRCLGNTMPIEVAHCMENELSNTSRSLLLQDPLVSIVDVCTKIPEEYQHIASSFQSYWIKPLALLMSRFKEPMLIDADAIFFMDPAELYEVDGYKDTGTLFFRDRLMAHSKFLAAKVQMENESEKVTYIKYIFKDFDPIPFQKYGTIVRDSNDTGFGPSMLLRESPTWEGATGHHQESSIVLFNKGKQPRAAKIMEYFMFEGRYKYPKFAWVREFYISIRTMMCLT